MERKLDLFFFRTTSGNWRDVEESLVSKCRESSWEVLLCHTLLTLEPPVYSTVTFIQKKKERKYTDCWTTELDYRVGLLSLATELDYKSIKIQGEEIDNDIAICQRKTQKEVHFRRVSLSLFVILIWPAFCVSHRRRKDTEPQLHAWLCDCFLQYLLFRSRRNDLWQIT